MEVNKMPNGITSTTKENVLLGEGALYLGYVSAALPGTLLGAIRPGASYKVVQEFRQADADGNKGSIKGLEWVTKAEATITAELIEFTEENLRAMIAGATYSSGTTVATDEAVGTGDGATVTFSLDSKPVVWNSISVTVAAAAKVEGVDYVVDYTNGTITFATAPATDAAIVATYTYISGDAVITGGDLSSSSYLSSIALVGKRLSDGKGVICVIENAICLESPEISMSNNEESAASVTFTSRYLPTAITTRPFHCQYINT
jgi:hypothetical protein